MRPTAPPLFPKTGHPVLSENGEVWKLQVDPGSSCQGQGVSKYERMFASDMNVFLILLL